MPNQEEILSIGKYIEGDQNLLLSLRFALRLLDIIVEVSTIKCKRVRVITCDYHMRRLRC